MRLPLLALTAAACFAAAAPAYSQTAADCKTVEVKWTVPEYAANGHFTLNIAAEEIVNPWSDSRTAIIRGKLDKLSVEGNQISFRTREFHDVTVTVDANCKVIALTGKGDHPEDGPYDIMLGKE
jgi:hypothetical protein